MVRTSFYNYDRTDPIDRWLSSLNLKDLQRACIVRGLNFRELSEMDVGQLQSWVYLNYYVPVRPSLLLEYDKWRDNVLQREGYMEEPLHIDLKLGFYKMDENGREIREHRNSKIFGENKSKEEMANFVPRKGSKKTLAYKLVEEGLSTKEIIERVLEAYPDVSEGSIKVWCSQARKILRIKKELGDSF